MIEELSDGYKILQISEFEEGGLPRKLYQVTQKKIRNLIKLTSAILQ
ncbi:hypothetical protein [Bacillus sp. AFS014408]|nr:hypothetical protein [Bacillus sp. AFS014408]